MRGLERIVTRILRQPNALILLRVDVMNVPETAVFIILAVRDVGIAHAAVTVSSDNSLCPGVEIRA